MPVFGAGKDRHGSRNATANSQLLRKGDVEAAARPVLRRKFTNAGAAAKLVKRVQEIDDSEPQKFGARPYGVRPNVEVTGDGEVELRIGLLMT